MGPPKLNTPLSSIAPPMVVGRPNQYPNLDRLSRASLPIPLLWSDSTNFRNRPTSGRFQIFVNENGFAWAFGGDGGTCVCWGKVTSRLSLVSPGAEDSSLFSFWPLVSPGAEDSSLFSFWREDPLGFAAFLRSDVEDSFLVS
jgi:hypothetical protein